MATRFRGGEEYYARGDDGHTHRYVAKRGDRRPAKRRRPTKKLVRLRRGPYPVGEIIDAGDGTLLRVVSPHKGYVVRRGGGVRRPSTRWIQKALKYHKKGSLHRQIYRHGRRRAPTYVRRWVRAARGDIRAKIPMRVLRWARAQRGLLGQRARLAYTLRGLRRRRAR